MLIEARLQLKEIDQSMLVRRPFSASQLSTNVSRRSWPERFLLKRRCGISIAVASDKVDVSR
jgi:hypothetical protein